MSVCRLAGVLAVLGVLMAAFTPLPNVLASAMAVQAREGPADAIVVLGGAQYPDGALTDSSLRRAVHGIKLWRRGLAPKLIFTGGRSRAGVSEASVRARLAVALGVPTSAILRVETARTTHEEALAVAALSQPRGVRRILLVTNALHLARASGAFVRVGLQPLPAPALEISFVEDKPGSRLRLLGAVLGEAAARAYYRAAGFN